MITFFRRFGMLALFFTALYATFASVSNVQLKDWLQYLDNRDVNASFSEHTMTSEKRHVFLQQKRILTLQEKELPKEWIAEPQTIEEVLALEQYPTVEVTATGYTAGVESTGKSPEHPAYGVTYSGVEVKRDVYSTIAADLEIYPLGTIMYIPGYGYGVVADKGGAIVGQKIDLYYPTVADVYEEWGKKDVEVYILKMGDGQVTEQDLQQLNDEESLKVFYEQ